MPPSLACGCTLSARCAAAWELRDQFDAITLDGSAARHYQRLALVHQYGAHVREAGLFYTHMHSLAHPFWEDHEYDDPRQEAPHAD